MTRLAAAFACAVLLAAQGRPVDRAWDLLARGQRQQAEQVLREILRKNPSDADARLMLGSLLAEAGDHAGAIAQLSEAVKLRPRSAEAENALGEAYNGFGQVQPAREAFEQAAALDPKFSQAQVNLGLVLLEAGDFDGAAGHLDHAIALLGRKADAGFPHYLRAKVYSHRDDTKRAAAELEQAVALQPSLAEAWSDLGVARKMLGDDAGALAAYERAARLNPRDGVAQYRLGTECLHQGKARAAVEHLRQAYALQPEDQSTLNSLQMALRATGQTEQADQVRRKLTELLREKDKQSQSALQAVQLNNQGAQLDKAGDLRDALEKYRAAVALYPEHVGMRVNLAVALLRLGQWDKGIAQLREALKRDPNNQTVQATLRDALAQKP